MAKYQIRKYGDGTYMPGSLIPYFWSWCAERFPTYELALKELNNHIKALAEQERKRKIEIVYEIEC